jgi:hypothetical protein
VKGAITFRFDCEADEQAQAYWRAMIEASRPTTCVSVSEVVIQLDMAQAAEPTSEDIPEATIEEDEPDPSPGFPRPKGWS